MFPYVSVSAWGGPHVTVTHNALDLTVLWPTPSHSLNTPQPGPPPSHLNMRLTTPGFALLQVPSGFHNWRPIQTCSFQDPILVLTSSGEVCTVGTSGMHRTGMLSCNNSL